MSIKQIFSLAIRLENVGIRVKKLTYVRIAGHTHSIIRLKSGVNLLPETIIKLERCL